MPSTVRFRPRPPVRVGLLTVLSVVSGLLVLPLAGTASAAPYDRKWTVATAGVHRASPVVGDLSVGRVAVIGDVSGHLRAIRGDGSVAWRSPVDPAGNGSRTAVQSSPAIGDLTMNGSNEVVVTAGYFGGGYDTQHGGVVAYRGDGSVLWRFRTQDRFIPGGRPNGYSDPVYSSPAIGDVDGDGRPDVVFGGLDHNIWALRGSDGSVIPGFPFENTDTVFSSPALHDIDRNGTMEILIGGDQSHNACCPGSYNGGVLRALSVNAGRVNQLWRFNTPNIVASSPAVGDINGDGRLEVVFGSGGYAPYDTIAGRKVWAVHADNGSLVPGWPQSTEGMVFGSPALGDVVPGDNGRAEVVVGDVLGKLYAWRGNGALAWKSDPGDGNDTFWGSPSIGDADGDGDQDVAIGYGFGGALLVDGRAGNRLRRLSSSFAGEATPAFADFGGVRRLIFAGFNPSDLSKGEVVAFDLPASASAAQWPMFRRDPQHRAGGRQAPRVRGAILERYTSLGGERGYLGKALTAELATPQRPGGRFNHFQGGSIYWTSGTGAWAVRGAIKDRWARLGWENSYLGFPLSNEYGLTGGAYGRFQGGSVYWTPSTGAQAVRGDILKRWGRVGYERGPLGWPTTSENQTPSKPGAFSHFQAGSVYWSPGTGAWEVRGAIRGKWASLGWENGFLGFPVTGENPLVGGAFSRFQGGHVYWSPGGGAHHVIGAIFDAWGRAGWERSCLGFPTTDQYAVPGGLTQNFQRGTITWSPAAGARVGCR